MQPAKIHFGDLAVLDSNECQYQLDGQKCNFCQKLSRELAISDFEMKKNWMVRCILQKEERKKYVRIRAQTHNFVNLHVV